jgi:hypothetical protein
VLLGRDLSAGGLSVQNAQGVQKGAELELALHSYAGEVPLVVSARVLRVGDAGEAALQFVNLSDGQRVALQKMVFELGDGDGLPFVSEIVCGSWGCAPARFATRRFAPALSETAD